MANKIISDSEMIINPDGSFNSETFMSELKVKSDYQAAIAELKELNAWDRPLGE